MREAADKPDYMRLLDAEALTRIGRLELIARGLVEGFVAGRHRSPYRGFSVEFAEHREYVAGDDTRDIDWRVYAKSDRYYVKRYIEETNLRSVILLDASGSMKYAGQEAARRGGARLSKFAYGQYLAASLAYLMVNQQDAVGLVTFDAGVRRYIPPRSRATHLRVILQEINATEPGKETRLAPVFHDIADRVHRRGLVVVISDLFDDPGGILRALHHFRYRKHEVIVFHVMAEEELTFPFDGWSEFRDLEDAQHRVPLDPHALRAAYLDEVGRFIAEIEKGCGQMSIDYVPLSTKHDFDVALATYLARRRSLKGL